jgi:alanine racemase
MQQDRSGSWIEISLDRIVANYRSVQSTVTRRVAVMPVLKGDAYGHGAIAVALALAAAGARWLAVAHASEGIALRQNGVGCRIVVLQAFDRHDLAAILEHDLTPVIHSVDGLAQLDRLALAAHLTVHYHLKIDTGLHRFGTDVDPDALLDHVRRARAAKLEALMTHLAAAADFESSQTDVQLARLETYERVFASGACAPRCTHAAATTAVAYGRTAAWRTMVRPGDAIYGYVAPRKGAGPDNALDVHPALSWKTRVVAVKGIAAGELIGYGASALRTTTPRRIALLDIGYGDGLPQRMAIGGHAICRGRLLPFLGSVSMTAAILDVTEHDTVRPGDVATLIGSDGAVKQSAADIGAITGGNTSSVVMAISPRTPRMYSLCAHVPHDGKEGSPDGHRSTSRTKDRRTSRRVASAPRLGPRQ